MMRHKELCEAAERQGEHALLFAHEAAVLAPCTHGFPENADISAEEHADDDPEDEVGVRKARESEAEEDESVGDAVR